MNFEQISKKSSLKILLFFFITTVQISVSANENRLPLLRYWIQDRFVRSVALGKNDQELLVSLESLINNVDTYKKKYLFENEVTTSVEIDKYRYHFLHPQFSSQNEVERFIKGDIPQNLNLITSGESSVTYLNEIIGAYKNILDHEFEFPPKSFKTNFLSFFGVIKQRNVTVFDLLFENSRDSELAIKAIKKMNDQEKLALLHQFKGQLSSVFDKVKNSGSEILRESKLTIPDAKMKRFLEIVLSLYFASLPDDAVWDLIFLQMERPEVQTRLERFKLLSRSVGPHFHKLFQIAGRMDGIPDSLRNIFITFEEGLPPSNWGIINKQIQESKFEEFDIIAVDSEPIKVASMSQIHKAKVRFKKTNEEAYIALRILKPGVEEWLKRDEFFFHKLIDVISKDEILGPITDGVNFKQLLRQIIVLANEEKNFRDTVDNENLATKELVTEKVINDEVKLKIKVPKAFLSTNNDTLMAMRWAEGKTLDKLAMDNSSHAKGIAESLFQHWMESALFGSGFIHADLHTGNVLVRKVNELEYDVNVIDFGMTGRFSEANQQLFYLLAMSSVTNNHTIMARAIWEQAVHKPDISLNEFTEMIVERFPPTNDPKLAANFEKALFFAQQNGFDFDDNLMKLVRGYAAARGLLYSTNSELKVKDVIIKMMQENPSKGLKVLSSIKYIDKKDIIGILNSFANNLRYKVENVTVADAVNAVATGTELVKGVLGGLLSRGKKFLGEVTKENPKPSQVNKPKEKQNLESFICLGHYSI
ncbi:MAG: AarF/ABC1/UbiB kinase family protein [Bdellovibrionaceae bacterium]|nr:AarF/ABC1/UbiB kinase family protein [Pseudobdellovibrionaceae bacterium]